jgi:hypothetical protein
MSSIIKFFVAPDDGAAAGAARSGPEAHFESATYGNFDAWSSLTEWEGVMAHRTVEELLDEGQPKVVTGDDNDAPVVLAASPDLTRLLANADEATLNDLAEQWLELRADEGEVIDDELASELVAAVAGLATSAARTGQSLYCWIA